MDLRDAELKFSNDQFHAQNLLTLPSSAKGELILPPDPGPSAFGPKNALALARPTSV